jgi:hypothetical protein
MGFYILSGREGRAAAVSVPILQMEKMGVYTPAQPHLALRGCAGLTS